MAKVFAVRLVLFCLSAFVLQISFPAGCAAGGFWRKLLSPDRNATPKNSAPPPSPQVQKPLDPTQKEFMQILNVCLGKKPSEFSVDEERAFGEAIAAKTIHALDSRLLDPVRYRDVWEYCNLVVQAMRRKSLRPNLDYWKVGIIENDEIGAFSTPGGLIIITTGLLKDLRNEAELAAVIGHEMGHICRRHGLYLVWKGLRRTLGIRAVSALLAECVKKGSGMKVFECTGKFKSTIESNTQRRWGKNFEYEADRLGATFMYQTGYNPMALVSFIQRLPERSSRRAFQFHPKKTDRVKQLMKHISRKLSGFDQLRKNTERYRCRVLARLR